MITEFHQAEENQTSPFMAEILLYEVEQIEIIMLQYFKDYYRFMVEPKDNKEQDLLDEEESHSASAADAFVALFANRDEFKDENSTRAFFATAESTEDEAIVEKMMMWIIELTTTFNADSNVVRITADTANELGRKIEPFIKTCSSFQDEDDSFPSSSWPIVKLVR